MAVQRYYDWDKDTSEDFWDIVERIDEIRARRVTGQLQHKLIHAGNVHALECKPVIAQLQKNFSNNKNSTISNQQIKRNVRDKHYLKAVKLYKSGKSTRAIAKYLGLHHSTIARWICNSKIRGESAGNRTKQDKLQRRDMVKETRREKRLSKIRSSV